MINHLYPKSPDIESVLVKKGGEEVSTNVPDGAVVESGPIKSEIIRCPACGSSNVDLGTPTVWGTPVCCRECGHFQPTKRNHT